MPKHKYETTYIIYTSTPYLTSIHIEDIYPEKKTTAATSTTAKIRQQKKAFDLSKMHLESMCLSNTYNQGNNNNEKRYTRLNRVFFETQNSNFPE